MLQADPQASDFSTPQIYGGIPSTHYQNHQIVTSQSCEDQLVTYEQLQPITEHHLVHVIDNQGVGNHGNQGNNQQGGYHGGQQQQQQEIQYHHQQQQQVF